MSNGQHYDWAKLVRQVGGKIDSRHLRQVRRGERAGQAATGPDAVREPFECPSCGDRFPVPDLCPRCMAVPFDARTGRRVEEHVIAPAHGIGIVPRLRVAVVEATRRTAAARARRVSVPRIGRSGRRVRLGGIVSVLRPVVPTDGEHEPCGAYLRLGRIAEPCGCRPGCGRRTTLLREESAVGLLAVRFGSETVIAGVPRSVQRVAARRPGRVAELFLRDGQEVELVGLLERRVIELPRATGYRETPGESSLCVVGSVATPCWVLI